MPAVLSLEQLRTGHCASTCSHTSLDNSQIEAQRHELPAWTIEAEALQRDYQFSDYHQTIAFVNTIAGVAHEQDHHPELTVSYQRIRVRYNTHTPAGISINDFICAAKIDALYST